jgi:hypothetical protein
MEAVLQAVLRGLKGKDDVGLGSFILLYINIEKDKEAK